MFVPSTEPNSVDDRDTMAICVPTADCYLGLEEFGKRGTQEIKEGEFDIVIYEARKALTLLAQGNPNVLSLLWLPPSGYIHLSEGGKLLLAHRDLFVGSWVFQPFVGYAKGQLHKMEHGAHQGYMGEKRKALVAKHGFDCSNASHLIRLLRMGAEFLKTGELLVDRGGFDATELLDIKHGEWSLLRVKKEADHLFRRAENAFDSCTLPNRQDHAAINKLCTRIVALELARRSEYIAL